MKLTIKVLPALAVVAVGCSGSKSDPKTAGKDDLNPPGKVWTVTQDKAIELRWTAANTEEDFKGYYVFVAKKSDYDAKDGKSGVVYPDKTNILETGIPRCKENNAFFKAMGITTDAEDDCEGGDTTENTPGSELTGRFLAEEEADDAAGGEEKDELSGWVKCKENGESTPTVSLDVKPPVTSFQTCTIPDLTNGVVYGFVVASVMGDNFDMSWSSNLVWDAPSATVIAKDTTVALSPGEMATLTFNVTAGTAEASDPGACATPCAFLSTPNTETVTTPTLFVSRAAGSGAGSYHQRLYISAAHPDNGGTVVIQPRGNQLWDSQVGAVSPRIPGDAPATEWPDSIGTKYVVYNNQVFDFKITASATSVYFGKVVIGDVTYADAADMESAATIKYTVVLQTAANTSYYAM